MRQVRYKCDRCKAETPEDETRAWWILHTTSIAFSVERFDLRTPGGEHLCGIACLMGRVREVVDEISAKLVTDKLTGKEPEMDSSRESILERQKRLMDLAKQMQNASHPGWDILNQDPTLKSLGKGLSKPPLTGSSGVFNANWEAEKMDANSSGMSNAKWESEGAGR